MVKAAIAYHYAVQYCFVWLDTTASACFTGWKAIPVNKAFSFMCLHTICIITNTASIEIMAAVNKKISIAILSKNVCLLKAIINCSLEQYHNKWMKKLEPLVGIEPDASQLPVKHPNH